MQTQQGIDTATLRCMPLLITATMRLSRLWSLPEQEVNARDENGRTPLHTATQEDYTKLISTLIAFGAPSLAKFFNL